MSAYKARRKAAMAEIQRLIDGGKFHMSIPVRNDEDSDTILTAPVIDSRDLERERDEAIAQRDRYEAALREVKRWSNAYPLSVFPEPDFAKVREALEAHGLSLDAVSASNMRHAITEAGSIAREALAGMDDQ